MPVYRYRDLNEASRALWHPAGASSLVNEWRVLFQFSLLAPSAPPVRGVRRFRTIEESNQDTERWVAERVEAGRARIV